MEAIRNDRVEQPYKQAWYHHELLSHKRHVWMQMTTASRNKQALLVQAVERRRVGEGPVCSRRFGGIDRC